MKIPQTCKPADLAAALGRSERWVIAAAADGRLPSVKIGRFVRFTEEQVAEIFARAERAAREDVEAEDPWGRPAAAIARERARARRVS